MKQGISEEFFLKTNDTLHELCEKLNELNEQEIKDNMEIEKTKNSIIFTASYLIDESNGFIQTDDSEMEEDFDALFSVAQGFIQASRQLSHYRSVIANALNNQQDDVLSENADYLKMTNAYLKHYFKRALELTSSIKEKYKTHGSK